MNKERRTTDPDGNGVLFLCDQRACEVCYPECRHTNDIRHAKGFEFHRTNKGGFWIQTEDAPETHSYPMWSDAEIDDVMNYIVTNDIRFYHRTSGVIWYVDKQKNTIEFKTCNVVCYRWDMSVVSPTAAKLEVYDVVKEDGMHPRRKVR